MTVARPDTEEVVETILRAYPSEAWQLIPVLQEVQRGCRYLPKEALVRVGEHLGVPLSQVYRVATFYRSFSLVPRGEHIIRVCQGTACHLRGAGQVVEAIQRILSIGPDETTEDQLFTLETVNCLGACALAPVVVVDEKYFPTTDGRKIAKIIDRYAKG